MTAVEFENWINWFAGEMPSDEHTSDWWSDLTKAEQQKIIDVVYKKKGLI